MRAAGWKMSMKLHKKTDIAFFVKETEKRREKMSENAVEWVRMRLNERFRAVQQAMIERLPACQKVSTAALRAGRYVGPAESLQICYI